MAPWRRSSWAQTKPCPGEKPGGGELKGPTQGTGTVGVRAWDWEEPYWGPGIQGSTIATFFSEAEMVIGRNVAVKHPKPGSSKSQGS